MTYTQADRDLMNGHPLLRDRWEWLNEYLRSQGHSMLVVEVFRSNERQGWLYGAGRTPEAMKLKRLPPYWARPEEPRVTNAWSSSTSAHGLMIDGRPAAAALDVVPVGRDGKPFTADDPWDEFVATIAKVGPRYGLVHFHAPGKAVWDRPHLQLIEWSDRHRRLVWV